MAIVDIKQAFILQGLPQKTTQHWYSWLKEELTRRGYTVFFKPGEANHDISVE